MNDELDYSKGLERTPRLIPFALDKIRPNTDKPWFCEACKTYVEDVREHMCPEMEAWDKLNNPEWNTK